MTDDDWHAAIACIAQAHAPRPLNQLVLMDRQSLESSATISLRALTEAGWRVVPPVDDLDPVWVCIECGWEGDPDKVGERCPGCKRIIDEDEP